MQPVAVEFGYSETAFVLPPEAGGTARLRIFTPSREIPFAGHPTIGAAVALSERGPEMTLELGVGPLRVRAEDGRASLRNPTPLTHGVEVAPETVAACLRLDADGDPHMRSTHPPTHAGVGLPFVLAELDGRRRARRLHPRPGRLPRGRAPPPRAVPLRRLRLCPRRRGGAGADVRDGEAVRARMFAPLDGIAEDPATGSAACGARGPPRRDRGALRSRSTSARARRWAVRRALRPPPRSRAAAASPRASRARR